MPGEIHERLLFIQRLFTSKTNPLLASNQQEFLRTNRLHTNMTSGDVIIIDNGAYVLTGLGFKNIW